MVARKQEVTKYRLCLGSQAGLDSGNLMSRDETKIQKEKLTWFLYICDLQKIPGKMEWEYKFIFVEKHLEIHA